jgi:hypothetical protein
MPCGAAFAPLLHKPTGIVLFVLGLWEGILMLGFFAGAIFRSLDEAPAVCHHGAAYRRLLFLALHPIGLRARSLPS